MILNEEKAKPPNRPGAALRSKSRSLWLNWAASHVRTDASVKPRAAGKISGFIYTGIRSVSTRWSGNSSSREIMSSGGILGT